eukprot:349704-Chlamydomonas_euryale.AAC.8
MQACLPSTRRLARSGRQRFWRGSVQRPKRQVDWRERRPVNSPRLRIDSCRATRRSHDRHTCVVLPSLLASSGHTCMLPARTAF